MSELSETLIVNGWAMYAHPLFLAQVDALTRQVKTLKRKDPTGYTQKNAAKRLAAIRQLAFDIIPQDPTRPEYRQGGTLGAAYTHWFQAKFFQQYRLFFRYHLSQKILVLVWINDEHTKRAYESPDDAYRVFQKMLDSGHPSDSWDALMQEAKGLTERRREAWVG